MTSTYPILQICHHSSLPLHLHLLLSLLSIYWVRSTLEEMQLPQALVFASPSLKFYFPSVFGVVDGEVKISAKGSP
jgi:hypothetical protein